MNYLIGNDPKRWKTDIPTYSKVRYKDIYEGIDLLFYGNQRQLEYDVVVAPGRDYSPVSFLIEGAKEVRKTEDGGLEIVLGSGSSIIQQRPHVYQEIGGKKRDIEGRFEIRKEKEGYVYSFNVGEYDKNSTLIIDPLVLSYSTYLGGSGVDEAYAIAVDTSGNAYVAGKTWSTDFPILNAYDSTCGTDGNCNYYNSLSFADVFVTKLNPSGNGLVYSTYLGGRYEDGASAIAVDSDGNAYVAGSTHSDDFPIKNAYQGVQWSWDAFVTKLNPSGNGLVYSTYHGGSELDDARAIAVDSYGNAYVAGFTTSTDFLTKNAYQGSKAGGSDAFVIKIDTTQSGANSLIYSTYLGGSKWDEAYAIAVDSGGNAYVTGATLSTDFPTQNPYQGSNAGWIDAFVTKLNPSGNGLIYSTYLGGSSWDTAYAIAVDSGGNAYVAGWTWSSDFTTKNAYDSTCGTDGTCNGGYPDAFVTKLSESAGTYTLTVTKTGTGSGTVTSSPAGINCGTDCSEPYASGTVVTLTATPNAGSTFAGWSGDCTDIGNNQAQVTMDADKSCTATFNLAFPNISVSPTSHNFGTVNVGTDSTPQTFTISNTGTGNLAIGTIIFTGSNPSQFIKQNDNCSDQTVAPSGSCTLEAIFSPLSQGIKGANLSIPSNDPDTPTLNVPLSGTGQLCAVTFADVPPGYWAESYIKTLYC
ncbi:MAG: SBBP repeat-containing protein, partial [Thermodesulfovibrionales bacterium]